MVENLPAGAAYSEGYAFTFNRAAEEISGYSRTEITTLDQWITVLYGAEGEVVRGYYEADRQAGFPSRRIVKLTRKDGTQRDVEFSAFALGEKDIVIWVMHDITEGKLVEKALRASEEKFRIEE